MESHIGTDIELWWGTPVLAYARPLPSASALQTEVMERYRATGTNAPAWETDDDLLQWDIPATGELRATLVEAVGRITKVTSGGQGYKGRLRLYCHARVDLPGSGAAVLRPCRQSAWSGVHVLASGTEMAEPDGALTFADPRSGAGLVADPCGIFGAERSLPLSSDMQVLVPGWLPLMLPANGGESPRVLIVFETVLADLT